MSRYYITIRNETMEVDRETFYADSTPESPAEEAREQRNTAKRIYAELSDKVNSSRNTKNFLGFRKYSPRQKQARRLLDEWYKNTLSQIAKRDFVCLFCEPSMECLEANIAEALSTKNETRGAGKLGVLTLGALVTVLGAHWYENNSKSTGYETPAAESVSYQRPVFTNRNNQGFEEARENEREKNFKDLLENIRERYPNDKRLENITDYNQNDYFTIARMYVDSVKKQEESK